MRDTESRVLAIVPAAAVATFAASISVLDLHHKWVSHILVPGIWGLIFGLLAYIVFVRILRPEDEY